MAIHVKPSFVEKQSSKKVVFSAFQSKSTLSAFHFAITIGKLLTVFSRTIIIRKRFIYLPLCAQTTRQMVHFIYGVCVYLLSPHLNKTYLPIVGLSTVCSSDRSQAPLRHFYLQTSFAMPRIVICFTIAFIYLFVSAVMVHAILIVRHHMA